jgi:hypothetical protein
MLNRRKCLDAISRKPDRSEADQEHRQACSGFGKIATKLRHAFFV